VGAKTNVLLPRTRHRSLSPGYWLKMPAQVVAGVLCRRGRVLLAQRREGKPLAGLWEFPGGKVETGETPEAALIRELSEELNIIATEIAPLSFVPQAHDSVSIRFWRCLAWEGDPSGAEGQVVRWVRVDDLERYAMPPADEEMIGHLRTFFAGEDEMMAPWSSSDSHTTRRAYWRAARAMGGCWTFCCPPFAPPPARDVRNASRGKPKPPPLPPPPPKALPGACLREREGVRAAPLPVKNPPGWASRVDTPPAGPPPRPKR